MGFCGESKESKVCFRCNQKARKILWLKMSINLLYRKINIARWKFWLGKSSKRGCLVSAGCILTSILSGLRKKIMKWLCFISFDHGLRLTLSEIGILWESLHPVKGEPGQLANVRSCLQMSEVLFFFAHGLLA